MSTDHIAPSGRWAKNNSHRIKSGDEPLRSNATGLVTNTKSISAKQLAAIVKLAYAGAREAAIMRTMGVASPETWQRIKRDQPEVQAALDDGDDQRYQFLVDSLTRHGEKNFVPAMFELKSRYGWIENQQPSDSGPRIVINLPGALSLPQLQPGQTLEGLVIPQVEGARDTAQIEFVPMPAEHRAVQIESAAGHRGVSVPLTDTHTDTMKSIRHTRESVGLEAPILNARMVRR